MENLNSAIKISAFLNQFDKNLKEIIESIDGLSRILKNLRYLRRENL